MSWHCLRRRLRNILWAYYSFVIHGCVPLKTNKTVNEYGEAELNLFSQASFGKREGIMVHDKSNMMKWRLLLA